MNSKTKEGASEGTQRARRGREGAEALELDELTHQIIGAAMKVHTAPGPGLLESAYEACLSYELVKAGFEAERQKRLPVVYESLRLEEGYRIDLLVEREVIVELKAIARIDELHKAQLLSYLRLSDCRLGLLINFHTSHLRDGICRVINTRR
ncbi:MAG TPA: GxxExxY protein [Opitutaceae bacterium]|nr:GxxExxY protein [Opitutaceae bacterium]